MNISGISSAASYFSELSVNAASNQQNPSDDLASKIDKNSDGNVTKDEVQAWADDMEENAGITVNVDKMFDQYDDDDDGNLTIQQLSSALEAQRSTMQGPPPGGPQPPSSSDLASKIDSDGDGSVTKDELQAWADDMKKNNASFSFDVDDVFLEYDDDSDGTLTVDQLASALDANRPAPPQNLASNYSSQSVASLFQTEL